jgi:hypothetical protein
MKQFCTSGLRAGELDAVHATVAVPQLRKAGIMHNSVFTCGMAMMHPAAWMDLEGFALLALAIPALHTKSLQYLIASPRECPTYDSYRAETSVPVPLSRCLLIG